jgi:hypothetical protein
MVNTIATGLAFDRRLVSSLILMLAVMLGCDVDSNMTQSDTPNWMQQARKEREVVRKQSPELFDEVSRILFRADPIGINFEDNTDEYDAEAGSIIARLPECDSRDDVRRVVREEFVRWFGIDIAGNEERYSDVASSIWDVWQHHQTGDAG